MTEKDHTGGRSMNLIFSKRVVGGFEVQELKQESWEIFLPSYVAQTGTK